MRTSNDSTQALAEIVRICSSPFFTRAPVMRRLLHFLVAETLAGRGDHLKAYGVAVDGLGRNSDFDPQADSYPRVQVGRLRRMIAQFYAEHGLGSDDVQVVIPNGSYRVHWTLVSVPHQHIVQPALATTASTTERPGRFTSARWAMAATIALILLVGIAALAWPDGNKQKQAGANVTQLTAAARIVPAPVMDVVLVTTVEDADPRLAQRIDRILSDALHRSWALTVRPLERGAPARSSDDSAYKLTGTLVGADRKLLYLMLWNTKDDTQIWSKRIELADKDNIREALSPSIAAIISPLGIIGSRERRALAGNFAPGFPCMMGYAEFYTGNAATLEQPVKACLRQTLDLDPGYSPALAAEIVMQFRDGAKEPSRADKARAQSLLIARRAVDADPYSADAQMAMAMAAYANGLCDMGKASAMRALERNPYDSYAHARTGLFMFQCGDPDYETPLRRAWALDTGLPAITAMPIFVGMGNRGEGAAALQFARSLPVGEGYRRPGYALTMAVAYAAAGDRSGAQSRWRTVVDSVRLKAQDDPEQVIRRIVLTPQLAERTALYLRGRGVFG